MAAPNLNSATTITGKNTVAVLGTSATLILANAASSGKCLKVNSITVCNIDSSAVTGDVSLYPSVDATGTPTRFCKGISFAVGDSLNILAAPVYLTEGQSLGGLGSSASKLEVIVSYEELS